MSGTLAPLCPMLAPNFDATQGYGLCVVGAPHYVQEYVQNNCGIICKDVEKMRAMSDPLIRFHLLIFCMGTRLSYLSRNVTPDNMASSSQSARRSRVNQKEGSNV